jgi:hypothetical protein
MTQRAWIAGLLVLGLAAALAYGLLRPARVPAAMAASTTATHETPARHCARHAPAALKGLREGTRQAVVVVKSFKPPAAGGGSLAVTYVAPDGQRHELAGVAVHPMRAFTTQDTGKQQRFAVSLAEVGHLLQDGEPLCIEVAFAAGAAARGGTVEIDIELANKP